MKPAPSCRSGVVAPRSSAVVALVMATVFAVGTLDGCARHVVQLGDHGVVVTSGQRGWYTKKVVTKRAPETLFAEDGTICRVAPDRFAHTAAGDMVNCNWQ
jgi:hypothetical protein